MQLLADDPILNRYKSHNKSVRLVKRLGDVLTIVVVAGMLVFWPIIIIYVLCENLSSRIVFYLLFIYIF